MTVEELTKLAMQEMQVIDPRTTPTSEEYELGLNRLNTLVASLQNDMVFLAYQDTKELITVANQTDYTTAVDTYRVRHFDDYQINVLGRKDFDQFTTANDNGRTNVFVEYNYNPPIIQFAIAPTDSGDVYTYRRDVLVTEMVAGQDVSLKRNAIEMLILGLAFKLCPAFGVEVARREAIKRDYMEEMNKYRQAQTFRSGDEVMAPRAIEVI